MVVTAPRAAMAAADEPGEAGRAGTDLFLVLVVAVLAVHARDLVAATWLGWVVDGSLGFRAVVDVVTRAVTTPLALLLGAAAAVWIGAGARRALGRDFDLACVAVVPMVIVEVAASVVTRAADLELPHAGRIAVTAAGAVWSAALVWLAIRQARSEPGTAVAGQGKRAGIALVGLAALLVGLNVAWVLTHLDYLRPMQNGDAAPPFALARIEADGKLGEPVKSEDLADRVVVMDFWATWCKPCLAALPSLSALAAKGDVTVLSVNLDDPAAARALFDAKGYRSTLVADDGVTSDRYAVSAIPHMVIIDHGVVRRVARGDGELRDVIDEATDLSKQ